MGFLRLLGFVSISLLFSSISFSVSSDYSDYQDVEIGILNTEYNNDISSKHRVSVGKKSVMVYVTCKKSENSAFCLSPDITDYIDGHLTNRFGQYLTTVDDKYYINFGSDRDLLKYSEDKKYLVSDKLKLKIPIKGQFLGFQNKEGKKNFCFNSVLNLFDSNPYCGSFSSTDSRKMRYSNIDISTIPSLNEDINFFEPLFNEVYDFPVLYNGIDKNNNHSIIKLKYPNIENYNSNNNLYVIGALDIDFADNDSGLIDLSKLGNVIQTYDLDIRSPGKKYPEDELYTVQLNNLITNKRGTVEIDFKNKVIFMNSYQSFNVLGYDDYMLPHKVKVIGLDITRNLDVENPNQLIELKNLKIVLPNDYIFDQDSNLLNKYYLLRYDKDNNSSADVVKKEKNSSLIGSLFSVFNDQEEKNERKQAANITVTNSEFVGPKHLSNILISSPKVIFDKVKYNGILDYNSLSSPGSLKLSNYNGGSVKFSNIDNNSNLDIFNQFIVDNYNLDINDSTFNYHDKSIEYNGCGNVNIASSKVNSDVAFNLASNKCHINLYGSDLSLSGDILLNLMKYDESKKENVFSNPDYYINLSDTSFSGKILFNNIMDYYSILQLELDGVNWNSSGNLIDNISKLNHQFNLKNILIGSKGLNIKLTNDVKENILSFSDLNIFGKSSDNKKSNSAPKVNIAGNSIAKVNGDLNLKNINLHLNEKTKLYAENISIDEESELSFNLLDVSDYEKIIALNEIYLPSLNNIKVKSIDALVKKELNLIKGSKINIGDNVPAREITVSNYNGMDLKYNLFKNEENIFINYITELNEFPGPDFIRFILRDNGVFNNIGEIDRYINNTVSKNEGIYFGGGISGGDFENNKFFGYTIFGGNVIKINENAGITSALQIRQFLNQDSFDKIYLGSNLHLGFSFSGDNYYYKSTLSGMLGIKDNFYSSTGWKDIIYGLSSNNKLNINISQHSPISIFPELNANTLMLYNEEFNSIFNFDFLVGVNVHGRIFINDYSNVLVKFFGALGMDNDIDTKINVKNKGIFSVGVDLINVFDVFNVGASYYYKSYLKNDDYDNKLTFNVEVSY